MTPTTPFAPRVADAWSIVGSAPEAIEAALLQVYAPRDPLAEFLTGRITARQLRVMVEHLPDDSPAHRELHGPWADEHELLWALDSDVRVLAATVGSLFRDAGDPPIEPEYLPRPQTRHERESAAAAAEQHDQEAAELLATMTRHN